MSRHNQKKKSDSIIDIEQLEGDNEALNNHFGMISEFMIKYVNTNLKTFLFNDIFFFLSFNISARVQCKSLPKAKKKSDW